MPIALGFRLGSLEEIAFGIYSYTDLYGSRAIEASCSIAKIEPDNKEKLCFSALPLNEQICYVDETPVRIEDYLVKHEEELREKLCR